MVTVYLSLTHPVETVKDLAYATTTAGYWLYKIVDVLVTESDLMYTDPNEFNRRWEHRLGKINAAYETVKEAWETTSARDKVKIGTSMLVRGAIDRKAFGAVGTLFKGAKNKAIKLARRAKKVEEVAVITVEGIPVQTSVTKKANNYFAKSKKGKVSGGSGGSNRGKAPQQNPMHKTNVAEEATIDMSEVVTTARNINEFFNTSLGRFLKGKVTKVQNQIYKVVEKIDYPQFKELKEHLRKGDYFYLDKMHIDHIEVFDSQGRARSVINLTGKVNEKKTRAALSEKRRIKI